MHRQSCATRSPASRAQRAQRAHHHAVPRVALNRVDVLQAAGAHVRLNVVLVVLVAVRLRAAGRGRVRAREGAGWQRCCPEKASVCKGHSGTPTGEGAPAAAAPCCPPHLFMSVNSTGGRFWITLLRGLLSAMASVPPGRSSRRHSLTCKRRAGGVGAALGRAACPAQLRLAAVKDASLAVPPRPPHQALDDPGGALVRHKLHRHQVHAGVRQASGQHVAVHVLDALPLAAGRKGGGGGR